MRKILIIFGLIITALLTIGGCEVKTSVETSTETSFGLTIQDAFFAEIGADGKFIPVDNVLKVGEKINFVLQNVGKFKKGDDGLNFYDMDMEMKDSNGNIIATGKGLLGEDGHRALQNDISPALYTYFTANLPPGNYKIKLTIYDKIDGSSASKTKSFTVIE